jgi:hypothetical protein
MESILEIVHRPFAFQRRPRDLPGDLRVAWRVALVVLLLGECSHGKKATLRKLHALNWICYSDENRKRFESIIEGEARPDDLNIRIEPSLNRAIDFAVGERLTEWINGNRLKLTDRGVTLLKAIKGGGDCMAVELHFLKHIKSAASEKSLGALFSWTKTSN